MSITDYEYEAFVALVTWSLLNGGKTVDHKQPIREQDFCTVVNTQKQICIMIPVTHNHSDEHVQSQIITQHAQTHTFLSPSGFPRPLEAESADSFMI